MTYYISFCSGKYCLHCLKSPFLFYFIFYCCRNTGSKITHIDCVVSTFKWQHRPNQLRDSRTAWTQFCFLIITWTTRNMVLNDRYILWFVHCVDCITENWCKTLNNRSAMLMDFVKLKGGQQCVLTFIREVCTELRKCICYFLTVVIMLER